ncbi:hypothetical protein [Aeromonas sp. 97A]|uniref:hypothetical protein n=1 Tax=Aeromonas sp. 97A TaxID=3452731 RepID=UPI003F7AC606
MDETTESADAAPDDRAQAAGVSLPRQSIRSVKSSVKAWMSVRQQGELVAVTEAKWQMVAAELPFMQIANVATSLSDIDQRHKEQQATEQAECTDLVIT